MLMEKYIEADEVNGVAIDLLNALCLDDETANDADQEQEQLEAIHEKAVFVASNVFGNLPPQFAKNANIFASRLKVSAVLAVAVEFLQSELARNCNQETETADTLNLEILLSYATAVLSAVVVEETKTTILKEL